MFDPASSPPIQRITISREYGGGGRDLGERIARQLGWPILDQNLTFRVAERLRLEHHVVEKWDEHPPSLMARIASILLLPTPEIPASPLLIDDIPNPDMVAQAARLVIAEAGKSPPLIVVGHGAQCIFQGFPDTLHIRVVAPLASRVDRIVARDKISVEQATADVRKMDADRVAYLNRYFHADIHDPLLYDWHINTGRISIAEAAAAIVALVHGRAQNAPQNVSQDAPNTP